MSSLSVRWLGHDLCVSQPVDRTLAKLKVPVDLRPRVSEILAITGEVCVAHLDEEYSELCQVLVGRLARKRPSPLAGAVGTYHHRKAVVEPERIQPLDPPWPIALADALERSLCVLDGRLLQHGRERGPCVFGIQVDGTAF